MAHSSVIGHGGEGNLEVYDYFCNMCKMRVIGGILTTILLCIFKWPALSDMFFQQIPFLDSFLLSRSLSCRFPPRMWVFVTVGAYTPILKFIFTTSSKLSAFSPNQIELEHEPPNFPHVKLFGKKIFSNYFIE